ncbi:major facilitator superfamily domain-containing protein [Thelonectria olida]|uniref:Major facilitator superfamily domain-containing protein n=1 Tax=Thelonectria olida TaxID=1576542 RepID=A0A9P8W4J2_9HYPO|nr:major facilitator superfamily domain-containing protein [Thelonectria olida]
MTIMLGHASNTARLAPANSENEASWPPSLPRVALTPGPYHIYVRDEAAERCTSEPATSHLTPHANLDAFKVTWDGEDDRLSPRNIPARRKWLMVTIVCTATLCVTCASSIYTTTYTQISNELATTRLTEAAGLSTFVLGIALGPLLTGPLSEHYGRRPIYLIAWSFFIIWTIPSAVARNIETLIVARFFNGFSGSTFLSVVGGTVGDIFPQNEIQKPMVFVSLAPFVGPSIGPLLGGFINFSLHWRWTYYFTIIWALIIFLLIVFYVPETFHPVLLRAKAQKMRYRTGDNRYWAAMEKNQSVATPTAKSIALLLLRPFQLLFLEPMCFCLDIYSALLLGILYLFFGTLPEIFRTNHGMNLWQSGLAFLGIIIGMLVAAATTPIWVRIRRCMLQRYEKRTGKMGVSEPEYQLPPAILGGILIPIGLFWFAWTTQSSIHWLVPISGSSLFGCGVILVFNGVFTFLVEAYTPYAASALAANSFARAFIAAAFPLLQIPMYDRLGYHWATSVLAFLTLMLTPFPWLFFKYGRTLRGKSRFASIS